MGETVLFFKVCKVIGVFYRVHMKYHQFTTFEYF